MLDLDVTINQIGSESCNRNCQHCGDMATGKMPAMEKGFLELLDRFHLSGEVQSCYGDIFCIYSQQDGEIFSIVELAKYMRSRGVYPFIVSTAGINWGSGSERRVAMALAKLDFRIKLGLVINYTLSNYPIWPQVAVPPEANFYPDMTLNYFISSKFRFKVQIITGSDAEFKSMSERMQRRYPEHVSRVYGGHLYNVGRARFMVDVQIKDIDYGSDYNNRRDCLLNMPLWALAENNLHVGLLQDGSVLPACCSWLTVHMKIADANKFTNHAQLREAVFEFKSRLEKVKQEKGADFSCLDCVALCEIRDKTRLFNSVGKIAYEKIEKNKCELAAKKVFKVLA